MNTFLNRVKTFQCMTFVIVNVQALASALKECIFHFLSRNSEIAGEMSFHCIQAVRYQCSLGLTTIFGTLIQV